MSEKTLVMIKPDHVHRAREILQELDSYGGRIHTAAIASVLRKTIEEHYAPHRGKSFYGYLVDSFVEKSVVVAVYEGPGIVKKIIDVCGPTDPLKGSKETIRGKYSTDSLEQAIAEGRTVRNVIHRSDSKEEAEREIRVWEEYLR